MTQDILVAGETLIDFLPDRPGSLTAVEAFERRPGGAPANVAVGLTRLEESPLFWTRVGDDPFGQYLLEHLEAEGLSPTLFETDPDAQTTLAFVTHDDEGDREFSFYRTETADTRFEPGTIDEGTLEDCTWVHAGGVTMAAGRSRDATTRLLERASEMGCTISFDPNFRPELWPDEATFRQVVGDCLDTVDVLKATIEELRLLGFDGETPQAVASDALEAGPEFVFVTLGSAGAIGVRSRGEADERDTVAHDGFDVDVIDTTGAGDGFVSGVIAALRAGHELPETLAFANAVAATTTTEAGAMAPLPTRTAVESLLEENVSE